MDKLFKEELIKVSLESVLKMTALKQSCGYEFLKENKLSKKDVHNKGYKTKTTITSRSTLDAIYDAPMIGKIGVLNFASPTKPGGGWDKGILAQEETLARNSDLMLSLIKGEKDYYSKNKSKRGINTGDLIYSKNVTFWSNESLEVFPKEKVRADVVTCSMPNQSRLNFLQKAIYNFDSIYEHRIDMVLRAFALKSIDHIILGAWGCGVFGNDPKRIALAFKKVIKSKYKGMFRSIEFAIYDKDHNTPNFKIFEKELKNIWK